MATLFDRLPGNHAKGPRRRRGVFLLPSLFTVGNMFCGYACIVYSMSGRLEQAAPFIGIAIVLDMLDGRIARLTGTTSAFGVEFDSLADVISFGVAPAVLAFEWGLKGLGQIGWAAGFIFMSAAAMRLARFNIQTAVADRQAVFRRHADAGGRRHRGRDDLHAARCCPTATTRRWRPARPSR